MTHLRFGRRVVGEQVVLDPAGDGDVARPRVEGVAGVRDDDGVAARHADQRQRGVVLDAHRPRRIQGQPQHERAAGAHSVEQSTECIHAVQCRRSRMQSVRITMDRLADRRLTVGMTTSPYLIATAAAAVTSAAVGGLFYAFSTFVMKGLDRTAPADAITAMRGINAEAQANAPFLTLFVGVGAAGARRRRRRAVPAVAAGHRLRARRRRARRWWPFVVTMAFNVPLNNQLDAVDPSGLSAAGRAAGVAGRTSVRGRRGTTCGRWLRCWARC